MKLFSRLVQTVAAVGIVTAGASVAVHPFGDVKQQQSLRPMFNEATIDASTQRLFERACQNCHSEQTAWPSYSYVAPASWLLERDVMRARKHMNLSRWDEYSVTQRETLLAAIGAAVRTQEMPPSRFVIVHPEAALSERERDQIYRWAHAERRRLRPPVQSSSPTGQSK